jgi:hypothetical protein
VWRLRENGTGVISITVKPNPSRISFSPAVCDSSGTSFMPASPCRRGFRYRIFNPLRDPSATTPIEHASEVRFPVASETTYSGWTDETSRTRAPAARPGLHGLATRPGHADCGAAASQPTARVALAPSFRPEPRNPQQGLGLAEKRHDQQSSTSGSTERTRERAVGERLHDPLLRDYT